MLELRSEWYRSLWENLFPSASTLFHLHLCSLILGFGDISVQQKFVNSLLPFLPMDKILLPVTKLTSKKPLWAGTWLSLCPCIHHWWSEADQRIMLFYSIVLHSENHKKSLKMCIIGTLASILSNPCCLLESSWVTEDVLGHFSAVSLMLGASMKEVLSGFQRLCKIRLALNPDSRTGTKFLVIKSLAFDPPLHFPWFGW